MTKLSTGFDPSLQHYLQSLGGRESPWLQQLRTETAALPGAPMQIAPEQAQFLTLLISLLSVERILEIGTFRGYSSLAMALALPPQGQIVTCDISEADATLARHYWHQAGVADKITLHLAPALETLARLEQDPDVQPFDLIFIDADKRHYDDYYEYALRLARPGGLVVIDNVLWYGKVADSAIQDPTTVALRQLNQKIATDARVAMSLVPLGDGLLLAWKRPLATNLD
ncbi:class I SAM-dependent methyltransferase [Synechocystis sp. LKSZ1]|uniref:O-methyltransferase n=1 Tax=Synechocystis sp. LKSZ1 TaxID=3144951 RepID=UPI00336BCA02